jgi:formyltetrahydrofolate deformylase
VLSDHRPKVAILFSAYDHCLADLLYRQGTGELACDIIAIISGHSTARRLAEFHGVPFCLLTDPKNKGACEQQILDLPGQDVDLIVLARYMQISVRNLLATTCCVSSTSITLSCRPSSAPGRITRPSSEELN